MPLKSTSRPDLVRVTFVHPYLWADTVHLVGDFNSWDVTTHPMRLETHGWRLTLDLPAGRTYAYHFLIDGQDWHNDWQADAYVPNSHGGDSSVLDLRAYLTEGAVRGYTSEPLLLHHERIGDAA